MCGLNKKKLNHPNVYFERVRNFLWPANSFFFLCPILRCTVGWPWFRKFSPNFKMVQLWINLKFFSNGSGEPNSEFSCRTEPNRTFPISKSAEPNRTELFGQNFAELFGEPNRTELSSKSLKKSAEPNRTVRQQGWWRIEPNCSVRSNSCLKVRPNRTFGSPLTYRLYCSMS